MFRKGVGFLAIGALVAGCDTPFSLGGQDLEIGSTDGADAPQAGAYAESDATCDDGVVDGDLTATGGVGVISISHSFNGDCCSEWTSAAVISETEDWVIDLSYTNEAAECGCSCGWTLGYDLLDVAAGDWTVRADGMEATTSVQ